MSDNAICAACGQPIEGPQQDQAFCWPDPDGVTCMAHGDCLAAYDDVLAHFAVGVDEPKDAA